MAKFKKQHRNVLGLDMAYHEVGSGDPIVFLHGNPTSSYLWRNILPYVSRLGRCIAPDLIGMGDSAKIPNSTVNTYRFVEHRQYLDSLLELLGVRENVTLVVHDWGSGLGFDWANRHRGAVKSICYMEAIVMPITWDDWPEDARRVFEGMRSEAGEGMVLEKNVFVERILPASIMRDLTEAEMAEYRRPYEFKGEPRRPTLTWPREIPIESEPADVHQIVTSYSEWLADSEIPKLFINAEPGSILVGRQREFARTWSNQSEVTVPGIHFIQEDSPDQIGAALAAWYRSL
jgi:haloalkane dehalogenase